MDEETTARDDMDVGVSEEVMEKARKWRALNANATCTLMQCDLHPHAMPASKH